MHPDTFDRLSKRLGASTSRRGLLKAFVAGVAATLLGAARPSSTPEVEAAAGPYPTTFLKGVGYAEGWPTPYNPSTSNGVASGACTTDGSGHFVFFGSDEARSESAPMWSPTFTLRTGTSGTGRDDVGSIANMNANMIRMYDWDARNDHQPFLQYCEQKGIKVLVSVVNYYLQRPGSPYFGAYPPTLELMEALVRSFGNAAGTDYHPAVAGIIIGNEPRLNGFGAPEAITVTQLYLQAEQSVGFPSRPMIGHPVDFALYGGQYPCWGFWDPLVAGLASIKSRLFLAPQAYNDATYLFTNASNSGQGYVPLTWNRYQLPILFTEIGQDRTKPNYQTIITGQLTGSINYAAQHPGQLLGTAYFQYADKVWLCPTGGTCPSEGSFGAFSHSASISVTVPYTQNDFTHLDFYANGKLQACPNQTVSFDVLTQTAAYGIVQAAYGFGAACGGQSQPCCTTGSPCTSGLSCINNTCQLPLPCGGQGLPCCTTGAPCTSGLTCTSNVCQPTQQCGGQGQTCCATGTPCNSGLKCSGGTCVEGDCGGMEQPCCQGNSCNVGLQCSNGRCIANGPCGLPNQPCCTSGNPCTIANTVCSNGTCNYCGYAGQLCCTGNTCAQSTIICLNTGKCANCGLPSLPCCANNTCTAGTCTNGICTLSLR